MPLGLVVHENKKLVVEEISVSNDIFPRGKKRILDPGWIDPEMLNSWILVESMGS